MNSKSSVQPKLEKRNPKVSVLMCVFNEQPGFLRESIDSILAQTFRDFEVVLVDDGSDRSETIELLAQYRDRDERLQIVRAVHQGLTKSLNAGLKLCQGDYVCRHDSDDWSEPSRFLKQVTFLDRNREVGIVGSNVVLHCTNGDSLWATGFPENAAQIKNAFLTENPFCHGATMFRRELITRVKGYREEFECSQDYDLFWRICDISDGANLREPLYHHRRTATSISSTRSETQLLVTYMTRALGRMRARGLKEDFAAVTADAKRALSMIDAKAYRDMKYADNLLLAGDIWRGVLRHGGNLMHHRVSRQTFGRFARAILFALIPKLRKRLFS